MLCRAVLTAVAISYLVCVLWLSGMQKEDLDVNMLRKLQRHNVNIDDMSRESLKQQCLSFKLDKDNVTKDMKDKGADDKNKTTTESFKLDNQKKVKQLLKSDLKMILSNLRDAVTSKGDDDGTISDKKVASSNAKSSKKERPPQYENIQGKIFEMINSPSPLKDKTDSFDVKYDNSQPNVASIIHFWQTFTTTTPSYNLDVKVRKRISKKIRNPISKESINEQNFFKTETNNRPKESDFIKKLLADFIYTSTEPTTEKPTTAPIDLKRLSDQIEKLLQLYPQRGTPNNNKQLSEREVEVIDESQPVGYNFVKNGIPQKSEILDERYNEYAHFERSKKNNIKDSNTILLPINVPKNDALISIRDPIQASNNLQREIVQRYQLTAGNKMNFEPTYAPSTRITETIQKVTIKTGENVLTKDCIKEIAENVKAIVLKEMRKEIEIAPVTTSVATTTIFTTTKAPSPKIQPKSSTAQPLPGMMADNPQQIKTHEATQVMAKFMELFEEFKSIKDKTEVTSSKKKPQEDVIHQTINSSFNVNHSVPKVVINPYRDKKPPKGMPNLYGPFVEKSPRMIQNDRIRFSTQNIPIKQAKPITIQTNSDEIKPLGIRLSKPSKLIHQNIIIVTTHPPITQRYNRDKRIDKYEHEDEINRKDRYMQYPIPRQAAYLAAAKPQIVSKDKTQETFNRYRVRDGRVSQFKHQLKDDINPMDRIPYLNERERDYKTTLKKDAQFGQKFNKYDRNSELKDLFDRNLPYKHERIPDFEAKSSYQRPDSSRYYSTYRDNTRLPYKSANVNHIHLKLNANNKGVSEEHKHGDIISYGLLSHNRNPQRFHEKLESVDDWRGELKIDNEDIKVNPDVAKRLQLPLMREPRFDDTHFKNFLKTQQKVNDMLEKILSSKRNPPVGPESVETT